MSGMEEAQKKMSSQEEHNKENNNVTLQDLAKSRQIQASNWNRDVVI